MDDPTWYIVFSPEAQKVIGPPTTDLRTAHNTKVGLAQAYQVYSLSLGPRQLCYDCAESSRTLVCQACVEAEIQEALDEAKRDWSET